MSLRLIVSQRLRNKPTLIDAPAVKRGDSISELPNVGKCKKRLDCSYSGGCSHWRRIFVVGQHRWQFEYHGSKHTIARTSTTKYRYCEHQHYQQVTSLCVV
jgi:hypothetical protein